MDNNFEQFEQDIQEKPIDWREIVEKLIYNWKWFVLSVIIALIAGFIYSRTQNDVYEVKSSILIIDQSKSGQMNEVSVLKQLDAAGIGGGKSTSSVNNEEQVMRSTALMKRVVNRLELQTSYSHRVFMKSEDMYTASPLYVHLDSLSLSHLKSSLELNIKPENGQLTIDGSYNSSTFQLQAKELPAILKTPAGRIYILLRSGKTFPNEPIQVTINTTFNTAKYLASAALTTEVGKMADVIDLALKTSNVQKGQDILNTLSDIYNQDATEQNNLSAINTATFIDGRLKLLTSELGDVEKDVENYKKTNKLTDIDVDAQMYLDKNNTYDQLQVQVEMQQHLIKYVEEFIHNPANQSALVPNLGLTDVGLIAVIQKYNELVMLREQVAHGSSVENPALKTLNQQINATRKAIQISISNSRKGLQINDADLGAQNLLIQSKIRDIPRQEREFIEIKRQQQVKETLYLFLLQKREEASLNMAVTVPKGRVLNAPDDATQVGPHRTTIMLVFLVIGLLVPAVIIYLLEIINTSIRNRADVEKNSKIPVISELGHNDSGSIFIDYKTNTCANSELFRLLRAKLQFTLDHPTEKVILVTSTISGEGKTFVGINLSVMLSLSEKKVLIIGMDLRKPQLAKYFGIEFKDGITAYLSGQITDYKSLLYKNIEFPLLDVLPAGVIPPNPNELIMKKRFDSLLDELKKQYDYIVIDSAPVGVVSDSYLIDRVSDLTLYVCRARYTDKRTIEFINRIQDEKSLKRLFLVVNDVDLDSNKYAYHRKYGYGYGKQRYGYGYGYGKKKTDTENDV